MYNIYNYGYILLSHVSLKHCQIFNIPEIGHSLYLQVIIISPRSLTINLIV